MKQRLSRIYIRIYRGMFPNVSESYRRKLRRDVNLFILSILFNIVMMMSMYEETQIYSLILFAFLLLYLHYSVMKNEYNILKKLVEEIKN